MGEPLNVQKRFFCAVVTEHGQDQCGAGRELTLHWQVESERKQGIVK